MYWVRPTGERKLIQPVAPGALARVTTYEGHHWLAVPTGAQEPVLMSYTVEPTAYRRSPVRIGARR